MGCGRSKKATGGEQNGEADNAKKLDRGWSADSAAGEPLGAKSVELKREDSAELVMTVPQDITASKVTHAQLKEKFRSLLVNDREREKMLSTLEATADLLAAGVGGTIISVINEDILANERLRFHYLDNGITTTAMRKVAKDIRGKPFADFIYLLTAHNESDRWEDHELKALVKSIPMASDFTNKLANQPKDGGIVVSHGGTVKGAAMHIKYPSAKFVLKKSNGTAAGTRHASCLGFAEKLCQKIRPDLYPGIVFARSDGGGAHAFIPEASGFPTVLSFETLKIPSQQDMLEHFREKMLHHGKLMRKNMPQLARPASIGETVVTVVDGEITSQRTVEVESMVIRANNTNQELYAISRSLFEKLYEVPGQEITADCNESQLNKYIRVWAHQLTDKGFRLFLPNQKSARWVYRVQPEDMEGIATNQFQSPWDTSVLQPLRAGIVLGMREDCGEIYWMPQSALSQDDDVYVEIDPNTKKDILRKAKTMNGTKEGKFSL